MEGKQELIENSENEWEIYSKETYEYDNDILISEKHYTNEGYVDYCKSNILDESNNIFETTIFYNEADNTDCGELTDKILYTYYADNTQKSALYYELDYQTKELIRTDSSFTYPSNNTVITEFYHWFNGVKTLLNRDIVTYNSDNNILKIEEQGYDSFFTNDWQESNPITLFEYNSAGLVTKTIKKTEYDHDTIVAITESLYERDTFGNITKMELFFGYEGQELNLIDKDIFTYDTSIPVEDIVMNYDALYLTESYTLPFHKPIFHYSYKDAKGDLEFDDKFEYIYSEPTGLTDKKTFSDLIYPNPVYSQVNINQELITGQFQIQLFDAKGLLIDTKESTSTIDASNLNSGIYFYSITTEEGIYNGKFIKE